MRRWGLVGGAERSDSRRGGKEGERGTGVSTPRRLERGFPFCSRSLSLLSFSSKPQTLSFSQIETLFLKKTHAKKKLRLSNRKKSRRLARSLALAAAATRGAACCVQHQKKEKKTKSSPKTHPRETKTPPHIHVLKDAKKSEKEKTKTQIHPTVVLGVALRTALASPALTVPLAGSKESRANSMSRRCCASKSALGLAASKGLASR